MAQENLKNKYNAAFNIAIRYGFCSDCRWAFESKECIACDCYANAVSLIKQAIVKQIDTDVVPVVRCEKCMYCHEAHYENPGEPPYIKRRCTNKYAMANSGYAVLADGFCSYGEKGNKNTADDGDAIVADVRPVVHGTWLPVGSFGALKSHQCSLCNTLFVGTVEYGTNYCGNCGAIMERSNEGYSK